MSIRAQKVATAFVSPNGITLNAYFQIELWKLSSLCFLHALVLTNKLKLNPNWWNKSFHAVFQSKILHLSKGIFWLSYPCWAFCSQYKILLTCLSFGTLQLASCMGLRKGEWHCPLAFLHRVYRLGHFQMEIDALVWRKLLENFQFDAKANLLSQTFSQKVSCVFPKVQKVYSFGRVLDHFQYWGFNFENILNFRFWFSLKSQPSFFVFLSLPFWNFNFSFFQFYKRFIWAGRLKNVKFSGG